MSLVVYTASTTGPPQPAPPGPAPKYAYLSDPAWDAQALARGWHPRRLLDPSGLAWPDRRNAKFPKMLSTLLFPEANATLWIDANMHLKQDPYTLIDEYRKPGVVLMTLRHEADEFYDEFDRVGKKDDRSLVEAQREYCKDAEMPRGLPVLAGGFLYRKNCARISRFNLAWLELTCRFSSRDQLSLAFLVWKLEIPHSVIPHHYESCPFMKINR